MSVLERLNGSGRVGGAAVTLRPVHLLLAVGAVGLAASAWAVGMKAGYSYAKQDAALVLQVGMANEMPALPQWRAWADSNVSYTPPQDLALLFDAASRTIPGAGGMTTGDVWNGYQRRIERQYFQRTPERYPDIGPAAPAAERGPESVQEEQPPYATVAP